VARYTAESKELVRDAVDMEELVSSRTELRRAGVNRLQGLCPFHDERTPSFGVNPAEKLYYCFGCQASGDPFTFVMETEGVDFKGALELLADRYNVRLETEAEDPRDAERRRRRERLLELLDRTASYYERVLWEAEEAARARDYLAARGLTEPILREFRVGYAPSAWDRVLLASRRGGFSEAELYETGLAQRSKRDQKPYDRFRERIMFPLADGRGRVLGFGARAMRDNQPPKYLNTAEGDLFHKGRELYGAHLARAHATRAGSVIVCEGYTDVLAMHQAGLRHTVGIMGTALTEPQMVELGRMASRIELALDADAAGQRAMARAARVAEGRKLELRVVALPPGQDPAELVGAEGGEAMTERVSRSMPFVLFHVDRLLSTGDPDSPEGRDRLLEALRPVFHSLPASAMQQELVRRVAGRLALSDALVVSMLSDAKSAGSSAGNGDSATAGSARGPTSTHGQVDRRVQTERAFLALCIARPGDGRRALLGLSLEEHFSDPLCRRAAAHLREHLESPREGLDDDDTELAALIAELVVRAGEPGTPGLMEVERLQLMLARVDRQIAAALASGEGDVSELAEEREKVRALLDDAVDRTMQEGAGSPSAI
jgi:DNA primase